MKTKDKTIGLVLAVLAVPSGAAVLSIAGNLAGIVDVAPLVVWLVVFGLVLILPGTALLASLRPILRAPRVYPTETRTIAARAPELPDTLIIEGDRGDYFKPDKKVITPSVMRTLARGIKQGRGLGYADLVERKGAPFTRAEYLSIRAEMLSGGLWCWRGRGPKSGLELTVKGGRVFDFWHKVLCAESPPTPDEFKQGLNNLHLANERTKERTSKSAGVGKWLS